MSVRFFVIFSFSSLRRYAKLQENSYAELKQCLGRFRPVFDSNVEQIDREIRFGRGEPIVRSDNVTDSKNGLRSRRKNEHTTHVLN